MNPRGQIRREKVMAVTADLPDIQRESIRWLHGYMLEKGLSIPELSDKMRCSDITLSQLFSGKYQPGVFLEHTINEIAEFRNLIEQRTTVGKLDFIETSLARRIFKCCETSLIYQRIVFIFGASQIGKTTALEQFAKRGQDIIYVRMPEGGTMSDFLCEIAEALQFTGSPKNMSMMRRKIKEAFDDRMTLIVDEVHQVFTSKTGTSRLRSIEFIRELYDRCKCGVVLAGTNIFRDEIQQGRHKVMLEQLDLRGLPPLQLPDRPSEEDLNTFADAYHLGPATGKAAALQQKVIREHRLSRWLVILQAANRLADKKSERLEWRHVLVAHAGLEALGKL